MFWMLWITIKVCFRSFESGLAVNYRWSIIIGRPLVPVHHLKGGPLLEICSPAKQNVSWGLLIWPNMFCFVSYCIWITGTHFIHGSSLTNCKDQRIVREWNMCLWHINWELMTQQPRVNYQIYNKMPSGHIANLIKGSVNKEAFIKLWL